MDALQHNKKNNYMLLKILSLLILSSMVLIPLIETIVRPFIGIGIPGAAGWVQHLTLWIGLLGAVVATLNRDHLSVSVTQLIKSAKAKSVIESIINVGGIVILFLLTRAAVKLVSFQYDSPEKLGGWFPVWLAQAALPIAFISMALMMSWKFFLTIKMLNKQLLWLIPIIVLISILFI
jgi:TRAP-type C4-dicarboxylate transport system permease small subunit